MRLKTHASVTLLAALLAVCLLPVQLFAGGPAPFVLPAQIELRYAANLRTGPGNTFPVKRTAAAGERLPVLACNAACDWYLVEADGWVAAFLVTPVQAPAPIAGTPTPLPTPAAPALDQAETADPVEADPAEIDPVEVDEGEAGAESAADSDTASDTAVAEVDAPLITVREVPVDPNGTRVRFDALIYRGPGTNFRLADYSARQGEPITVVGRNSLGNWYVLVSGDWNAAAAIVNAPANLPIAWEPPPPPGGPERGPPPPVPAPVAAAHVVQESVSTDDTRYFQGVQQALSNYVQGSENLQQQFEQIGENPLLLFDGPWRIRTAAGIVQIREGNRIINELRPTTRTVVIHGMLLQVSSKMAEAMDLFTQAVDEVSADKMQRGSSLVGEASAILNETIQMIEALQSGN